MATTGLHGYVLLLTFSIFSLATDMITTKRFHGITKTKQVLEGTGTFCLQNFY